MASPPLVNDDDDDDQLDSYFAPCYEENISGELYEQFTTVEKAGQKEMSLVVS